MSCEDELDILSPDTTAAAVSCNNPKFVITCDAKTISFVQGILRCESADGKTYAIADGQFLRDEKCRLQYGKKGTSLDDGSCGCEFPFKLYGSQCKSWIQVCRESFGEHADVADTEWEDDWQCICELGYAFDGDLEHKQCVSIDQLGRS